MNLLPHIAARVFGAPLMIARAKLDVILSVLVPRLDGESLQPKSSAETRDYDVTPEGIAVIPVFGTLVRRTVGLEAQSGLVSYTTIGQQLDMALSDPSVKAILLDVDSPGGEAGGVFDLADKIYAARKVKPIWASVDEDAFSAAYAIAASASKLYVPRTGGVGSIGVIAVHLDQSQAEADVGLKYTAIYAGARKNDMSPHEPLSDPARAALQTEVDRVYDLFAQTVSRGRRMPVEAVKATEAGLFFGEDGVAAGLADKIGTFTDALADLTASLAPKPLRFSLSTTTNTQRKDMSMKDPNLNAATEAQAAEVTAQEAPATPMAAQEPAVDIAALTAQAKAEARAEALAYVAEVNELCQLAGMPDKAAGFVAKAVPVADIRKTLLTAKAATAEATAIMSQHEGMAGSPSAKSKIDTAAIYSSRNNPKTQSRL
jgi:signal peptide peptidase SppA